MDVRGSLNPAESLSAHDVLEANENDPNMVDRESLHENDEYELTELKNVGVAGKHDKEKEAIRAESPLEELTEDVDEEEEPHSSNDSAHRYIQVPRGERISLIGSQSQQQSQMQQRDSFYLEQPQTVAQDVMISGYQTQRNSGSSQSSHRVIHAPAPTSSAQNVSHQHEGRSSGSGSSGGYYILKNPSGGAGHVPIRIVHGPDSHSSSNTRVTVVPATRSVNGTAVLQLPAGQMIRHPQRVQIIHTPSSSHQNSSQYEHRVNVGDPGVTVTGSGTVGQGMHVVKKDQQGVSMLVDGGSYFHNGGQKVYRLVHDESGPATKRMRIVQPRSHPQQQVNMVSMAPSTSRVAMSHSQLGDEVIIDDGIQERTIVIDQDVSQPDSPLLAESPGLGSMMISGHQSSLGPSSPGSHPGYLQQSQYDADLQFQQLISSSLSRYDENEKAIMKFHIQRILLEARYGGGICQRLLLQDDELEGAPNGVSHELVSQ